MFGLAEDEVRSRTVYYDLETTGLGFHNKHRDIEIVEIGAVDEETRQTFRQYMLPPGGKIPRDASNVHGIYIKDGVLYRDEKKLESVDCKTGLSNFLSWLKSFNQPIILAGYNSHNYDDWVISHNLLREDLCLKGEGSVMKFLDVSKIVRPYLRSKLGLKKWSLTFAVKTCLERQQDDAHDAVSDSVDTLDLRIILKDEETPSKAIRESDYVQEMCGRIARGLAIEEPKLVDKKKENSYKTEKTIVDKKQPLMKAFFKVIPSKNANTNNIATSYKSNEEDKRVKSILTCEIDKITQEGDGEVEKRVSKRKRSVLGEISGNSSESVCINRSNSKRSRTECGKEKEEERTVRSRKERNRAPRAPRVPRVPRYRRV